MFYFCSHTKLVSRLSALWKYHSILYRKLPETQVLATVTIVFIVCGQRSAMTATNFSALIILISSLIFYSNLHGNPIILSENDVEFISTGWISKLRLFLVGSESFVAETWDSPCWIPVMYTQVYQGFCSSFYSLEATLCSTQAQTRNSLAVNVQIQ